MKSTIQSRHFWSPSLGVKQGNHVAVAVLAVLAILVPTKGRSCGMAMSEPRSHFDGVDYQGNVMLVEHLGEIDAGQGLKLPFYAVFGSNSGNNSPYAGYGWTVPLLEARLTQQDENTFRLDQPDGWFRMFWRSKNNPSVLEGQGGWKAEIRGDTVTAWADCGTKLIFTKGRLISIQIKERKLDFVYESNQLAELKEGVTSILQVEREQITGEVTGFHLSDQHQIRIERGKRPRVQVINNQSLVAGMDHALSKITQVDGTVYTIDYAVDEKLNPTLKTGNRLIVWSAASKKVIRDGEWNYQVKPGSGVFDSADIARKNAKNEIEHWLFDRGKEIIQEGDRSNKIIHRFNSGRLSGLVRKIENVVNGESRTVYSVTYSETGKMLREIAGENTFEYRYDDSGKLVEVLKNGASFKTLAYKDGRLAREVYASGLERVFDLSNGENGKITNILTNGTVYYELR